MRRRTRAVMLRGASITLSLAGALFSGTSCNSDNIVEPTDPASPADGATALALSATPLSFRQLSTGGFHTCGVTTDDQAYCWGLNYFGQLGDGSAYPANTPRLTPVRVRAGALRFRRVDAGDLHTCGITIDDRAYCWGNNFYGQLGDGTTIQRLTPVAIAGGLKFRLVRTGANHTCGVTTGGAVYCWGSNQAGQLGDGGTTSGRLTPNRVAGGLLFRQLSAGAFHSCGTTTGDRAYCWGYNPFGQLGDGTIIRRNAPVAVTGGLQFSQVVAGGSHTCGVTADDRAYCWGENFSGELGDGTTTRRLVPTPVAGGLRFRGVSPGASYTCGVSPENLAYCWGNNFYGRLGDGTVTRRLMPVAVVGKPRLHYLSAASRHTCAVTALNRAYCWGNNFYGQLGDGTTATHLTPVAVAGPR